MRLSTVARSRVLPRSRSRYEDGEALSVTTKVNPEQGSDNVRWLPPPVSSAERCEIYATLPSLLCWAGRGGWPVVGGSTAGHTKATVTAKPGPYLRNVSAWELGDEATHRGCATLSVAPWATVAPLPPHQTRDQSPYYSPHSLSGLGEDPHRSHHQSQPNR